MNSRQNLVYMAVCLDYFIVMVKETYSFGIKGNALQWLNSYPFGRSQFVVCGDSVSELRHLPFGVPQGSVLGPT